MGSILGIIPLAQSAALAGESAKFAKKPHKNAGDFVGEAAKTIVGASLIGETADILGSF